MSDKHRQSRSLPILITLIAVAALSYLLRSVVAQSNFKVAEVPPYPVFVLPTSTGDLLVVEHSRNQVLKLPGGNGPAQVIAGNGKSDYSGDGGPATAAGLFLMGIALDRSGNLYIADHNHNRIRRVDRRGRIETIAGTGVAGYSGDGGPAKQAQLSDPAGVAVDNRGNVLVADSANNRIRSIDPDGKIRTLAGTGTEGFSGDGSPARRAKLSFPWSVTVDATGRILIADTGNNRIRSIDPDGKIRTLAGTGAEGFSGDGGPARLAHIERPQMAVADRQGNIFVADTNNNRIRRIGPDGVISTVAGNGETEGGESEGVATRVNLSDPYAVGTDDRGNLYIADTGHFRVCRVDRSGQLTVLKLD
ncbi:hypothetical protein [Gloeobacter kilaueensis]|uniref:Teneurin NHL domain-containing protein n=1 Tax=Gloeobacter kilaueensis (strain ATCC BAA-2537 / CCAP 1431/1 / ULC 316 / JS1) TaxID=1183438 RepID=U5QIX4_GLOK1|nr:hypothetical protein [Gloeobacter kilaueensis]AGY58927.1 hypothetical protein GKIL_2681 [Gloeobacter kilaueensis JS1]